MEDFDILKKKALERFFSRMNPMQKKAVFHVNGPLLILAGAGSGKTTVLVSRIANMIHFGNAYEHTDSGEVHSTEELNFLKDYADGLTDDSERLSDIVAYKKVRPWNILAITFTNKAAGELKDRIARILGDEGTGVTAATFHSACVRILRREGSRLGFSANFAIYDTDDTKRLLKSVMKEMDISDKMFPVKSIMAEISNAKDEMVGPEDFIKNAAGDYRLLTVGKIYRKYQQQMKDNNSMDFDDIITYTVELFENEPDVLDHYQNLYRYIMVDEYQDTNKAQFRLVALLSSKYKNLCVVGDDDQSIYKFRGATIENILNFEDIFECDPESDVIKLEQNYRSTQNILTCANELIKHNKGRKGKNLWTDAGDGDKVVVYKAPTEREEALFIAEKIQEDAESGIRYSDHAVLYRMNAQSNSIEQAMIKAGVPYRIFGGVKFYERKEIKDILAYLELINNHSDVFRMRRIVNEPKRGIGEATVRTIEQIVSDLGEDPVYVMSHSAEYVPLAKKSKALTEFAFMIEDLTDLSEEVSLTELLDAVLHKSGYENMLKLQGIEGEGRLENIAELRSTIAKYEEDAESPDLGGFLEEVALYTDLDTMDPDGDYVMMMTMHSAKGLEFPVVFLPGMEDNVFPSMRSFESEDELEEERRLAYVAVTRAKRQLYIINSSSRMLYGNVQNNKDSIFVRELPKQNIRKIGDNSLQRDIKTAQSIKLGRQLSLFGQDKPATENLSFSAGDRVVHKKFGGGTVIKATPMAGDTLLEIAFDTMGTKKLMANFARLKKE
ncbi:MAG: UvrD-helicase domain-containing protein [Ruminococcus sp.]|nr:UvrD-helicase domain-containing protein [Ruminococcus sp.]